MLLLLLSFTFEPTVGLDLYSPGGPGFSINAKITMPVFRNVELDFNLLQLYFADDNSVVGLGFFESPEVNVFLPTKGLDIYLIGSFSFYDDLKGLTLGAGIRYPVNPKFSLVGEGKYKKIGDTNIFELMGGIRIPFSL